MAQAPTEYRQEVRFAVVMYGGVSLAIYINGIAQELLRLVRSTAEDPQPGRPLYPAVQGTEAIYRRIGQILRIEVGTVSATLHAAHASLRRALNEVSR